MAAKEGAMLAWELGLKSVVLEWDAREVYESFDSPFQDLLNCGQLSNEVNVIASWFDRFKAQL